VLVSASRVSPLVGKSLSDADISVIQIHPGADVTSHLAEAVARAIV
jgi:hypothetical protein